MIIIVHRVFACGEYRVYVTASLTREFRRAHVLIIRKGMSFLLTCKVGDKVNWIEQKIICTTIDLPRDARYNILWIYIIDLTRYRDIIGGFCLFALIIIHGWL